MNKFTNLQSIIQNRKEVFAEGFFDASSRSFAFKNYTSNPPVIADGWHIYVKVRIPLRFWSPKKQSDVARVMKFIELFAKTANMVADNFNIQLLEIQGKVLHFILEQPHARPEVIRRFANVLMNVLYPTLNKFDREINDGIAITADYGEAVLLTTNTASIISLGESACRPAKRLVHTRSRTLEYYYANQWHVDRIKILTPNELRQKPWSHIYNDLSSRGAILTETISKSDLDILFGENIHSRFYEEGFSPFQQAATIQGFFARADLDGFTAKVKSAFESSDSGESIGEVVKEFREITEEAENLITGFGEHKTISLNWAGDCANFIVLPLETEDFKFAQDYLPATIGARWHSKFKKSSTDCGWVVGVSGAPMDQQDIPGTITISTLEIDGLNFRIAAGWSVGESLRAQEVEGAIKRDTIINADDYRQLDENHSSHFKALKSTNYFRANSLDLNKLIQSETQKAVYSTISAPYIPRPYYFGD